MFGRKHLSRSENVKKRRRNEQPIQSKKEALDKFIIKENIVEEEKNDDADKLLNSHLHLEDQDDYEDDGILDDCENKIDRSQDDSEKVEASSENGDCDYNNNPNESILFDIYDPRNWDSLDSKSIDNLVRNGPKRDLSILKGPKDKYARRFSSTFYTRCLTNGEKCDRDWLVYSKELDRMFCFCCKIFKKNAGKGILVKEGFGDWRHIGIKLKEHETSRDHLTNMVTWNELRLRLQKNETIDEETEEQPLKEKEYWREVLFRVIAVVKYLSKHNLELCGMNENLYRNSDVNFLGLFEMLVEFDPIIQEHVRRSNNNDLHHHHLGHKIRNKSIQMLALGIKRGIIKKVREAKYFSVILDCTPDASDQEQMSLILRCVNVSISSIKIEEFFLEFLVVNDITSQGLFEVLQNVLKSLNLDIDNVRGQSYDSVANMKERYQGVQKRFSNINPRAFYTPYGSHSLNLTLCDIANSCGKAREFFGVIRRIYSIFSNSTQRWQILENNIKLLTLKSLSVTRWESCVESVKAIRFQISEIQEALLEVADKDNDSKIRSEAISLATNDLCNFEFLLAMVIWYEILSTVALVSKNLQAKDMLLDVAIVEVKGLISFFENYREVGFPNAMDAAKEIAIELRIDPIFLQKHVIRRKNQFDESVDETPLSSEEFFRVHYFLYIIDQSIVSLTERFEQYQVYENIFGFLFTSDKLQSLDDKDLKSCCTRLEAALLKDENCGDINGDDLYIELKLLRLFLPTEKLGATGILNSLTKMSCFPNASIAYKILLTIPITIASSERSFSKLKLLRSYLRSSMSQERLDLALISIENESLEDIDIKSLVDVSL